MTMQTTNNLQSTYEMLTDYTNYEWKEVGKEGVCEWVEGDISLKVFAKLDTYSIEKRLLVWHSKNTEVISADYNDPEAVKLAVNYAQFMDNTHFEKQASQAEFDAYLLAHKALGGNYDFTGSEDGITAIVGSAGVFCEWNGRRYELYDHGLIRYAITADGLKRAYAEIVEWTEAIHRNLEEQNA